MKKPRLRRQALGGIQDQLVFQRSEEICSRYLKYNIYRRRGNPLQNSHDNNRVTSRHTSSSPSHAYTCIRPQSILQPFEPCLDDREGRPRRLYRSDKPEARIRALEEALPRRDISFAGANQRQHVQIADPAGNTRLGSVIQQMMPNRGITYRISFSIRLGTVLGSGSTRSLTRILAPSFKAGTRFRRISTHSRSGQSCRMKRRK